jgi:regulator of protease activity HflC (stomatin/prohibitin superfamily)
MAKAPTIDRFRRGETVKTLDALPGVPEGTRGRVELVAGFAWTRYRVLFENGVDVGSLDGSSLARPKQFDEALARRAEAEQAEEAAAEESEAGGGAAAAGEGKTVNGVSIPAHLLDRSKRARERLGAAS